MASRQDSFKNAQSLLESEKVEEAFDAIHQFTTDKEIEYTPFEMEVLSNVLSEKLTRYYYVICPPWLGSI